VFGCPGLFVERLRLSGVDVMQTSVRYFSRFHQL